MILSELIRLLEIDVPKVLGGEIAQMGLRHIEYGLQTHHVLPFRDVMVDTLKRAVTSKGHKWSHKATKAWNWAIAEIAGMLMDSVTKGKPLVEALKR